MEKEIIKQETEKQEDVKHIEVKISCTITDENGNEIKEKDDDCIKEHVEKNFKSITIITIIMLIPFLVIVWKYPTTILLKCSLSVIGFYVLWIGLTVCTLPVVVRTRWW